MKLKNLLASTLVGVSALMGLTSQSQAAIATDIIMIVDESGSMGTEQVNLRNNIGLFASILSNGGVDARYGLVGYGSSGVEPRMLTYQILLLIHGWALSAWRLPRMTWQGYIDSGLSILLKPVQTEKCSSIDSKAD